MATPKTAEVAADDAAMRAAQEREQAAQAQADPAPDVARLDTTEPGKAAYLVNGQLQGPNGRPLKADGTEEPPLPGMPA